MKKRAPKDILGYLKQVGPASTKEIERVFGLSSAAAKTKLSSLERAGKVRQLALAKATHWAPA